MAKKSKSIDDVLNAALQLAATRSWRDIRLSDIAGEAGLTLSEMGEMGCSKTALLKHFSRRTDLALLKSLEKDPVEGDVHDKLFDILMRRMEMLEPLKPAIRNIIDAPADGLSDWAMLMSSTAHNQAWILAAAGIDDAGPREAIKRHGLVLVSARAMQVWVDDDDPGLARTMAELDRRLRDGAVWLSRLQAPIAMGAAFARLARGFVDRRGTSGDVRQSRDAGQGGE